MEKCYLLWYLHDVVRIKIYVKMSHKTPMNKKNIKNKSKVTLDFEKGKLFLKGTCSDVLDTCKAQCCRSIDVYITKEEFQSKRYHARALCLLTKSDCKYEDAHCLNTAYVLKRKEDGTCFYLNDNNMCSAYKTRPLVCKQFSCSNGWMLSPSPHSSDQKRKSTLLAKKFIKLCKDDMIFICDPLTEIKTIFYSKQKKTITFIKKMAIRCGLISVECDFHTDKMDDAMLINLIKLFDAKNTLGDIRRIMNKKYPVKLSKREFYELIWIFYHNDIIVIKNQN
ncbi:MAG: YkgJ family cysteine cluster protein [Candidatus Ancaeobacter aquaticus]|nr:YkgJ family cysteine cluster protein [Candidatus Ancaeobacter aquaticus]